MTHCKRGDLRYSIACEVPLLGPQLQFLLAMWAEVELERWGEGRNAAKRSVLAHILLCVKS